MKSKFLLFGTGLLITMLASNVMLSNRSGAIAGRAGDPTSPETCFNGCHMGSSLNSGPGTARITSNIPVEGYEPDSTYTIRARIEQDNITRFGFQVIPFGTSSNEGIGTVALTEDTRTRIRTDGAKQYVTHTTAGTDSTNANTWSFDWTAPAAGSGEVVFYGSFLATNANNNNQGDQVYAITDTIQEAIATSRFADLSTDLSIIPQALEKSIQIEMNLLAATSLEMNVIDLSGRTLFSQTQAVLQGPFRQTISTQGWSTGVYVVILRHERGFTHEKVQIQ